MISFFFNVKSRLFIIIGQYLLWILNILTIFEIVWEFCKESCIIWWLRRFYKVSASFFHWTRYWSKQICITYFTELTIEAICSLNSLLKQKFSHHFFHWTHFWSRNFCINFFTEFTFEAKVFTSFFSLNSLLKQKFLHQFFHWTHLWSGTFEAKTWRRKNNSHLVSQSVT
jgi:hypothetical protein